MIPTHPPKKPLLSPGPICFTTLQHARHQLQITDVTKADDDDDLFEAMQAASSWIERYCGQNFTDIPYTEYFFGETGAGNPTLFLEGRPLHSVAAVYNGDGTLIPTTSYEVLPKVGTPITDIRLTQTNFWVGPQPPPHVAYAADALRVDGQYGYHSFYAKAWKRISLTATVADATTETLTLSTTVGTLIDVGNILRLGGLASSEQVLVTGPIATEGQVSNIIASGTTITVKRGINLTTAAAQSAVVIDVWQPEFEIGEVARMISASKFHARAQASGEVMSPVGFGPISTSDIPKKARDKLVPPLWNFMYGQIPT